MADKKVERSFRERPLTPAQKMNASLSDQGSVNMAEPSHDKGKAALTDRFREREDRWRREQALRAQQVGAETQGEQPKAATAGSEAAGAQEETAGAGDTSKPPARRKGGSS